MKRFAVIFLLPALIAFGLIQLIPYRISNGAARNEPTWDSPRTRELAVAACYDCHSNEVRTPWYGKIAPISWWLTNHVNDGRAALNFSDWKGPRGEGAREAAESVREGSMPPSYYTWFGLHSKAKLSKAQQDELAKGLTASLGK